MLSLIQEHTRKIYNLEEKEFELKKVKARDLLNCKRFDLFAKLYYIDNIRQNSEKALLIYSEHIKAFNPDGREPGRDDKTSLDDFISEFDRLIQFFESNDFDSTVSLVPVDEDGVILDGAHRVAALAYYDREVTIAHFKGVKAKCAFDYNYFKNRGLKWEICDIVAFEMVKWLPNVYAACLWPTLSQEDKRIVTHQISNQHCVVYDKQIRVSLKALTTFVKTIYREQDWTNSDIAVQDKALRCYGKSNSLDVVFFDSQIPLNELVVEKEGLRNNFKFGKDSLHITDSSDETCDIAKLVLDVAKLKLWNSEQNSRLNRFVDIMREKLLYFHKVQWVKFKVFVSRKLRKFYR